MTTAQARLDALLTAKRKAREQPGETWKPKSCVRCGKPVGNPVCEDGTRGVKPLCWECWSNDA